MSKPKKVDPGFVPEVIDDDWGDERNFFAFIPHQIEADWHEKWGPLLEGFPLNIVFAGVTKDRQTGKKSIAESCYWPDLATFHEDSEHKEMCYFTEPKNGYSIRVVLEKASRRWRTEKFKGNRLVRTAFGSTFDQAMIQTTMGGPEQDER